MTRKKGLFQFIKLASRFWFTAREAKLVIRAKSRTTLAMIFVSFASSGFATLWAELITS